MSAKIRIEPKVRRLILHLEDIEKGLFQIPAFQRDFVWDKRDKLELFDSIKRGYPIGSILLWQPEDFDFKENHWIGPYKISRQPEAFSYILDGFQRLSTLFGCLINPKKTNLEYDEKDLEQNFSVYYDLRTDEFFVPRPNSQPEIYQVPLYILMDTFEFLSFSQKLVSETDFEDLVNKAKQLSSIFLDYQLPSIHILGGKIEEAVEIFSRINSKGATISPDWMVSALTYNKEQDFRLGSVIDNLIEELKPFNFDSIKRDLIMKCITHSFGKAFFDQTGNLEKLARRSDFISVTRKTIESIKKSVKFLFENLFVLDIKLLPYPYQLVFITDFFNMLDNPNENQLEELKKWFWVTTYSNYFTIYSLSKQRQAYQVFHQFLRGESTNIIYNDKPEIPFVTAEFPAKLHLGSVRANALALFLLGYSNQFNSLDSSLTDGFNLSYLFYDLRDQKGYFQPESAVPMISETNRSLPKSKDASFLFDSDEHEHLYGNYFLTPGMRELYQVGKRQDIISLRKELIMKEEMLFVEQLGLKYDS
jgi:uncharacterized protein with ParB-like and HNH nuclease domain